MSGGPDLPKCDILSSPTERRWPDEGEIKVWTGRQGVENLLEIAMKNKNLLQESLIFTDNKY